MIPEAIRRQYPFEEAYAILETITADYQKRNIKVVQKNPSKGKRSLGQNGITYLARISHKSKFLFSGFIDNISTRNSAVLYLILRAHLETTASLGYFLHNLKKYYNKELTYKDIDTLLYRLSAGSRHPDYRKERPSVPESVNVLTTIEACDKLLPSQWEGTTKDDKLFSTIYTELSEVCHPNSMGLLFGTLMIKRAQVHFSERPSLGPTDNFYYLIEKLIMTCSFYFMFYDRCITLLKDNEQMPTVKIG